ncbi:MAG: hypothetical protein GTN89_15295 [Acidobacteria bacterium]|nr:hypothetical protein [Acidobacteriota bacterium]NIQ31693.1 hypothetical protein [Acidobacteriota bacterium]NIQ86961.1 hypothetical protein [Acidobacteriota bacterium]
MTGLLSLAAALALSFPGAPTPEPNASHTGTIACVEPSDELDVGARVVSTTDLGATVRVEVDLSILPERNVPTARIRGKIHGGPGFDEAFGIPDEITPLTKGNPKHKRFELEIPKGQEHGFVFHVRAEENGVPSAPSSTAYLRVNLDPTKEPEVIDGRLQYRANMGGE